MKTDLTVIIADDEPFAREHIRTFLIESGVKVLAEADSGAETLQLVEDLKPDIVLLDIMMPGITGMQTAAALSQMDIPTKVVFLTGYSEFAVEAFQTGAIDYILKPVSRERLHQTLERYRKDFKSSDRKLLPPSVDITKVETLRRIPVRSESSVKLLRLGDVLAIVSKEKRVLILTESDEFRTYFTLTQLDSILPSDQFCRVHDSAIVNLDLVEELISLGNHQYEVRVGTNLILPVGRSKYTDLIHRLGLPKRTA